jgi:hypothetical protein
MKDLALPFALLSAFCLPALAQYNTGNDSPVPGAGLPVILVIAIGCGVYWFVKRRRRKR